MRQDIGIRLRQERERLGLSQAEFAALGQVSPRSQTGWEIGEAVPNAEFLELVAVHGVDVLYVVTGARNIGILPDDESAFLAGFRALNGSAKDVVLGILIAMDTGTGTGSWDFSRAMRLLTIFRAASEEEKVFLEAAAAAIGRGDQDAA